jgi:hypothetical protein
MLFSGMLLFLGGTVFLAYRIISQPAGAQSRAARPAGAAVTVVPVEIRTIEIRKSYYGTVRSARVQKVTYRIAGADRRTPA